MEDQQTETTLPARFRELAEAHGIDEAATDYDLLGEYQSVMDSVYRAALATIEKQTAGKVAAEIEHLLHQDGAPRDDQDLALVLALFIYARHSGEGAQIVVDGVTFGDHEDQSMIEVRIEPNARRGDFDIDVLVSYKEYGPHPHWMRTREGPSSITVIKEAALLRKRNGDYAEAGLKRRALNALGLTPVTYDADEIERDPFALARRVIDDLSRTVDDAAHES
jgi:hypothetical protein